MRGKGKKPENGKQRRRQRLQTPDDGDGFFSSALNDDEEELSEEQRYWQSYFEETDHLRHRGKRKIGRKGKYRNRDFE